MSAIFQKNDTNWTQTSLKKGVFSTEEIHMLISTFDAQTDYDEKEIVKELRQIKFLKKVCLLKMLLFPLETFLRFVILGKKEFKNKNLLIKLYFNFYINKISYSKFKKDLQSQYKNANII